MLHYHATWSRSQTTHGMEALSLDPWKSSAF
jgi:hypothetical protein